ncbi:Purine nucleoside permease [Acidisarcina polymorpha]|uniref:Purine nucleoside permease n=2 Tax=Acidisarcina polymorpha TaxID=2211140 RepID=A0A2Z5G5H5_9BACT|nr:Purine nucleoside permease [Acidisarcina polymorpha]
MFELGADTGDAPGEYQYWVEREHLDQKLPFPAGNRDLRMNAKGVLAISTGQGTAKAASSIMALGLDPRFDLSRAYWIIAGIAGADPAKASLGSAVWTDWVVDGDLGYEIDAREIPEEWPTGYVPLGKLRPYELPVVANDDQVYQLNSSLTDWAYRLTKDVPLGDTEAIRERRAQFPQEAAKRPPFVLKGGELSGSTYWHGKKLDEWANAWVAYYSSGQGHFVTTAMEDSGTLQSLTFLAKAHKVDFSRIMVLRTVSNFDQQRPGVSAAESLAEQRVSKYGGYLPSLESAYTVGHTIVDELVSHWQQYGSRSPAE